MRKEYYNYVVKLPVLLHELFRGKVADYHFSDMTVVMNHLVKSYIRMTDGGRVSTATRRILLCMDRIPDMSFFFRRQEKSVLFFEMDPAVAGSLQRAIIAGGWGNRQRLVVRLVCAFCCGAGVTLNNLSMELASEEVFRRPEGYLIHTYVSNYQYVFLKETAAAQRMSVEGMLTAAAELLVGTDDEGSGYHIPESLGRIADRVFEVRGSTLKDFRRQCLVSIRTNTIGPDRIDPLKNGGRSSWCHECVLVYKREQYRKHRKVADGTFMHRTLGRLVEHKGYSTRIFWNGNMLSIMRRHYHNTLNRELAEMLGVSERSVTRKAREMGLEKDKSFVASLSREHLLLANARSKELGYPGGFTKGMKFRGNQYTGRIRVE